MDYPCRACGSVDLEEVLDMGSLPLAGDFLAGPGATRYPLAVDHCHTCSVLQVRELVPHDVIFHERYSYASSTVPALIAHFGRLADFLARRHRAEPTKILEVGCNDGVLLRELKRHPHFQVVGVDASANVVHLAQQEGLPAYRLVFSERTAADLAAEHGRFDLVTCSNVFAHNPDPNDFVRGVTRVLRPGGTFLIEVHDTQALHDALQWDCFYHEHCFYWSGAALAHIVRRHGFSVQSIGTTPMHGGALRFIATFERGREAPCLSSLERAPTDWQAFSRKAIRSRMILHETVELMASHQRPLFLYGAGGRATILVNWADLAPFLELAFDGSPLRIGKHVPGTHLRIDAERELARYGDKPRHVLLGAWHLAEALTANLDDFAPGHQYRVVTPLPQLKVF